MQEKTKAWLWRKHVLVLTLLVFNSVGAGQTLNDLWTGAAEFNLNATGIGAGIGFHFPSMWWDGSTLRGYYITGYQSGGEDKYTIDRARSTNGLSWTNEGRVLDIGGAWQWIFEAENLYHQIGRADADGWSANTAQDNPGYLCYGPYTTAIPGGPNCASFKLMIDVRSSSTEVVVTVDVYDADAATILASRNIQRKDFSANYTYQIFNLNFTCTAGRRLEFRTYWHDKAYIRQDLVAIAQGSFPFWDGRIASFPGIWKDGGTWYLVYEGAGSSSSWPGDIGLATSTDGINFTKHPSNPILRHNTTGWERTNIGTPSLYKESGVWYLFYHGFNGTDCQIGVASGTSLTNLTKYSGNPILPTSPADWDSGTTGRRSQIFKEGSYYYFAYEGSTDQPYDTARWSTGLARSSSLLSAWSKCPYNPVVPQTVSGFGNDGPEMVTIGTSRYLYVRSGAASDRYILQSTVVNQPPQVNAGPDQTITLPSSANLNGSVTDDGLPNPPGAVTVTWSKTSGPGTVTFGNPNATVTTASFSTSGTYVLRLTASDSELSAYDEVTITVNPQTAPGISIEATQDTFIDQTVPDTVRDGTGIVLKGQTGQRRVGIIEFVIPDVELDVSQGSWATLDLQHIRSWGEGISWELRVRGKRDSFAAHGRSETDTTWNNRGGLVLDADLLHEVTMAGGDDGGDLVPPQWHNLDITDFFNANRGHTVLLILRNSDNDANKGGVIQCKDHGRPTFPEGGPSISYFTPCTDPVLLSAYSVMTHGAAGDLAVGIELDEPYAIEPRAGAYYRLKFVFDQEIDIAEADVDLSSGEATLSLAGTHILVATMTALPDNNECLTITVSGVKDATGVCEMTPATLYLTMIQGEVDGSPPVNLTDMSIVRADLYQPVTLDNFMCDVNADGVINLTDLSLVRDNLYQQAACP